MWENTAYKLQYLSSSVMLLSAHSIIPIHKIDHSWFFQRVDMKETEPLSLISLGFPFILMLAGSVAGMAAFLWEWLLERGKVQDPDVSTTGSAAAGLSGSQADMPRGLSAGFNVDSDLADQDGNSDNTGIDQEPSRSTEETTATERWVWSNHMDQF